MNSRQADATARELLFDWQLNSRQADATARELLFDCQHNSRQADAQTQWLLLRGQILSIKSIPPVNKIEHVQQL